MKHIFPVSGVVNRCFTSMVFGLLMGIVPAVAASVTPEDRYSEVDSIRKQQMIVDQLDFISENTIPRLDEIINFPPPPELTPPTIEGRLQKLEHLIPLTYNNQVQKFIDRYSSDRYRGYLSRMMGLGQYYFELYDRIFEETGLPKEIKYLSVIESALNPHAVSRVGATGPWQFMFATARMYGLQIDSDVDERRDPVISSYAASRYLLESYERFGDWLLAIASYNCGPGNVSRAIRRSGLENPDFWDIQQYLPRETRNYIPAFIAMTYMLEYHDEYGISPAETEFFGVPTETVNIQQSVHFSSIAEAIEAEEDLIQALNPAYKHGIIKGSLAQPRRLVLPMVDPKHFGDLYAVLNEPADSGRMLAAAEPKRSQQPQPSIYTVKRGDSLSTIASRHKGATVSSIKLANGLKSDRINPGMKLKIK